MSAKRVQNLYCQLSCSRVLAALLFSSAGNRLLCPWYVLLWQSPVIFLVCYCASLYCRPIASSLVLNSLELYALDYWNCSTLRFPSYLGCFYFLLVVVIDVASITTSLTMVWCFGYDFYVFHGLLWMSLTQKFQLASFAFRVLIDAKMAACSRKLDKNDTNITTCKDSLGNSFRRVSKT